MTQEKLNQILTEIIVSAEAALTVQAAKLINFRCTHEDLKLNIKKEELTHIGALLYHMVLTAAEAIENTEATLFPDDEQEKSPSDTSAQAASGEPD